MKKQLESLANEMITEIKDLKDLTKKELPEIAKEYIKFNLVINGWLTIISILGMIILLGVAYYFFNLETNSSRTRDTYQTVCGICSLIGGIMIIPVIVNLSNYLEFKYQPRRKAIEAITSLL